MEDKYKEQVKISTDGTKHTVRTADHKTLHRKVLSTPIKFQRPPEKDMSPTKHQLRGPAEST